MWPEWSAWTWWGIALSLTPFLALPTIYDYRHALIKRFGNVKLEISSNILVAMFCMIAVSIIASIIWSAPTLTIKHSSMSVEEQKKVKAECEMLALEKGGSPSKAFGTYHKFRDACLEAKGFVLQWK